MKSKRNKNKTPSPTKINPINENNNLIIKFKVNKCFILIYTLILSLNGICVAYTIAGNNQASSIFSEKLGWNAEQTRYYNTIINSSS